MTLATHPRTALTPAELVAYGAVVLALLAAAIPVRRRAPQFLRLVDTLTRRKKERIAA